MKSILSPTITLPEMIAGHARWHPEREAVVDGDRRMNWRDFNALVNRVANALLTAGLQKGDKAAVLMLDSIETLAVHFGIVKAGGVIVPLSPMVAPGSIERMIADSGSTFLFVAAPLNPLLAAFETPLLDGLAGRLIALGFQAEGWTDFAGFIGPASTADPGVEHRFEDEFVIVYSSGTTGVPKGIVHTHFARDRLGYTLTGVLGVNHRTRTILTTPLFTNGTWVTVLPTILCAGTLILMPRFDPQSFVELVEKERATHTLMVPTQYIVTLHLPGLPKADLSSLKCLVSVGSTLRQDVREKILETFPCEFYEIYGLTEGPGTLIDREDMLRKPGSVGKPGMGNDIRILDMDGKELPPGEVGEIVGYAAGLMKGYHNRPDLTEEILWEDERGRTYLKTGDIGKLDEDGFLYVLDRKRDMIVTGGINVFACDIEEVFGRHPEVLDVAVIAVPHEKWGETPRALVVLKESACCTEQEIQDWANERLGKFQRVSGVEFRSEFARNALGKILKKELRAPYWERG